jgi:23S rRNA (cytidine1920-2'-O)/16S rRNA (cytidine1409-2'-O)-methyltransferase
MLHLKPWAQSVLSFLLQQNNEEILIMRLDQHLVMKGFYQTRARAQDAIARGTVRVDGRPAKKSGQPVEDDVLIEIADPASAYVSRAALKLKQGLAHFKFDLSGKSALDIGASTGGFTQVLLEQGCAHVSAIDVGHGQLHPTLSNDPRVVQMDGCNARYLKRDDIGDRPIDVVVSDVSFISLKIALPPALSLATSGAVTILLVKPQFEAGRKALGKGGILKDPTQGPVIANDLLKWLDAEPNWSALEAIPSPITGSDGNIEYLIGGIKA